MPILIIKYFTIFSLCINEYQRRVGTLCPAVYVNKSWMAHVSAWLGAQPTHVRGVRVILTENQNENPQCWVQIP